MGGIPGLSLDAEFAGHRDASGLGSPGFQPPLELRSGRRRSVLQENVDRAGRTQVVVGVALAGHVFHQADIPRPEHNLGAVAGADFDLAGEVDDEPGAGQSFRRM